MLSRMAVVEPANFAPWYRPAIMISPVVGGSLSVSGNSTARTAAGLPSPGRIPTIVPRVTPISTHIRFIGVRAEPSPSIRLCSADMEFLSARGEPEDQPARWTGESAGQQRPGGQRDGEGVGEQQEGRDRDQHRGDQA